MMRELDSDLLKWSKLSYTHIFLDIHDGSFLVMEVMIKVGLSILLGTCVEVNW